MSKLISPSVLSADFGNLEKDVRMLNNSNCDWIHCDVMDGIFVPNISFGLPVIKAISRVSEKPLDVHLMIEDPGKYVKDFKNAGAWMLTVHQEAVVHLDRVIHQIREEGMKAGVSLNPGTSIESIMDILGIVDMVLLMSVNPGFGGQKFIDNTYNKLRRLHSIRHEYHHDFLIQVDGGVTDENAGKLFDLGADCLVAGSYIFKASDPEAAIQKLKTSGGIITA